MSIKYNIQTHFALLYLWLLWSQYVSKGKVVCIKCNYYMYYFSVSKSFSI